MAAVESVISTAANIFLSMGLYVGKQFWGAIVGAARKAGNRRVGTRHVSRGQYLPSVDNTIKNIAMSTAHWPCKPLCGAKGEKKRDPACNYCLSENCRRIIDFI
ncbi:hypothetical protein [Janthinobacterium sp. AD80]|uniref:hypothetical protein n=1 Tax=unclassified Janthinobacterium TaxID=2610881 RepID=UPI0015E08E54|nr:hypothetical protein [Janthinobacterium sp. AD80]